MAANIDLAFGVTNIKTHIPVVLDLNDHNYDAWRELFQTHCLAFDVVGHIDGTSLPQDVNDAQWHKRDGLVKLWIYGTLAPQLFKSSFETGGTARDIWTRIEAKFRNNKEARAIQLDNELRTTEIGDLSIEDYSQKLKSLSDRLANVDAAIPDRTLVTYLLNGLNERFDNIINVIQHREPFPSFATAKSMLQMEETRLKRSTRSVAQHSDHSSSTTALTADASTPSPVHLRHNNNSNRGNRRNGNRGYRGRNNNRNNSWNNQNWPPQYQMPQQWMQYQFPPWLQFMNQASQNRGLLGPRPSAPQNANIAMNQYQPTTDFAHAFNTLTLSDPGAADWYMDSGATSHLTGSAGMIMSNLKNASHQSVVVGNGSKIPVTYSGSTYLPSSSRPLALNNVLVTPQIIKNLVSVRKFTTDNWCSVEFDPFGFSVKDLLTRKTLLRSNSQGDLYSVPGSRLQPSSFSTSTAFVALSPNLWHKRLAHTNKASLSSIISSNSIVCNKESLGSTCTACQLGKQIKLPFFTSTSQTTRPFQLIHSDIWTSPKISLSGIRYYALFLDDHTHFLWVYPLRRKSELFSKFLHFFAYVKTQFQTTISSLQCDNGGEYNNSHFHQFFDSKGIQFRFSCPHSSQQNGKSERMIRTINNAIRSLLFQAKLSSSYWVEALHTAVHILNILPSSTIKNEIPYKKLFNKVPTYEHLRVFGCLCFPNINHSNLHKLSARSSPSLFLGYPTQHRGYRCMDLKTNKIIISRHVVFDETLFPASVKESSPKSYEFLDNVEEPSPLLKQILQLPITPHLNAPDPQPIPAPAILQQIPPTGHSMTTRSKAGVYKPKAQLSLVATVSPIPKSYIQALSDPNWTPSMTDEIDAFHETNTWDLVPKPKDTNVVRCMWLHKHKLNADGSFKRYRSRLVANGKSQEEGVDYNETFSPVVKPATIRSVLNVSLARDWPIHQLDVKNAFLHGNLEETIYMHQPPGFVDKQFPDHVCRLNKAIYGLKQAPRAWNSRFANFVLRMGFVSSRSDASLFVYKKGSLQAYLLLYVDDIILTASTTQLLNSIIQTLKTEFPMSDSGKLSYFLGVSAEFINGGIFLSQRAYAEDIIKRAGMENCKPCVTPVDVSSKLSATAGEKMTDPTHYRSLAGALQYLTFTRPDISYAVNQICLFMHDPRLHHYQALKRIIRYIQGTKTHGLQLVKGSIDQLTAYTDADWAGCPDTRRSTSGYCVYLGNNLLSWSSKRQPTVSRSSSEAEYKGVANVVAELCWIRNLLLELDCPLSKASIVYCDNISSVYLTQNPVKHQRTKHIELDIHFVREKVALGEVKVLHVPTSLQFADIFTKGLPRSLFTDFRDSLTVRTPDASAEGGY